MAHLTGKLLKGQRYISREDCEEALAIALRHLAAAGVPLAEAEREYRAQMKQAGRTEVYVMPPKHPAWGDLSGAGKHWAVAQHLANNHLRKVWASLSEPQIRLKTSETPAPETAHRRLKYVERRKAARKEKP